MLQSRYCDARKSWKKHVLKTSTRQNHNTMMPKMFSLLKSPYYDARLYCKKNAFKTSLRQNHTTMIPKKYRLIKNHSTMMPENIEKTMYLSRDEVKITVLWHPKKEFFRIFCLKSHYFDAQKYWCPKKLKNKHVLLRLDRTNLGFHGTKIDF